MLHFLKVSHDPNVPMLSRRSKMPFLSQQPDVFSFTKFKWRHYFEKLSLLLKNVVLHFPNVLIFTTCSSAFCCLLCWFSPIRSEVMTCQVSHRSLVSMRTAIQLSPQICGIMESSGSYPPTHHPGLLNKDNMSYKYRDVPEIHSGLLCFQIWF